MKIQGLEGMSASEIQLELQRGARFVVYSYCISLILVTFRRPSEIYFLPAGSSRIRKGLASQPGDTAPGLVGHSLGAGLFRASSGGKLQRWKGCDR